MILLNYFKAVI